MIKLICSNINCAYSYSISDDEFRMNGKYHSHCLICGSRNELNNLEEIIASDLDQKVKDNLKLWFKTIGAEATIEMCERNRGLSVYRLYKAELERMGFKLRGG